MNTTQSYIISVSAGKGCYRHICISAGSTLFDLHAAILDAFEFSDDHAHAFFMDNRVWSGVDSYYSDQMALESRYTCDFSLKSMALRVGKHFKYVFDFGDEWVFQCKVLRELDGPCDAPVVVCSKGEAPEQYSQEDEFGGGAYLEEEDFPEVFSPAMLKKLYSELALPDETVVLLRTYFDAMARLYGVISLHKALEIINSQNEPISEEKFTAFAEIARHEEHYYCILGEDEMYSDGKIPLPLCREIVEQSLYAIDLSYYYEMINAHKSKSYYVLPKSELLKYADQGYYESTRQSRSMQDYLRHQKGMTKARAEVFVQELQLHASMGKNDVQLVMDDMTRMGMKFECGEDVGDFVRLYTEMSNHSRMAMNRGHTPVEITAGIAPENRIPKSISFGPNMTAALQNGTMDIEEFRQGILRMEVPNESIRKSMLGELNRVQTSVTPAPAATEGKKKKIGRNNPCPCGSGKKYKNCCGRNL